MLILDMSKILSHRIVLTLLRVAMGWLFLWTFLDKTFGLGYSTVTGKAWLDGVSPTMGFLKFGTTGPLAEFFQSLAGNSLVDVLYMLGLFSVGLALILGVGMRVASYAGSLMMLLIYLAVLFPSHNPVVDEHLIYILVLLSFWYVKPKQWYGFGQQWQKTDLVKKLPFLA
jgi:thiosulfate dehydrogenase (quinone) large subunit